MNIEDEINRLSFDYADVERTRFEETHPNALPREIEKFFIGCRSDFKAGYKAALQKQQSGITHWMPLPAPPNETQSTEQSNESEDEFANIFNQFISFSIPTFKDATSISSLEKLTDEVDEVATEIIHGHNPKDLKEEFVDCFMCLFDSQARAGISIKEFKQAFNEKLAKNKSRKWVKNANNTYSHQ